MCVRFLRCTGTHSTLGSRVVIAQTVFSLRYLQSTFYMLNLSFALIIFCFFHFWAHGPNLYGIIYIFHVNIYLEQYAIHVLYNKSKDTGLKRQNNCFYPMGRVIQMCFILGTSVAVFCTHCRWTVVFLFGKSVGQNLKGTSDGRRHCIWTPECPLNPKMDMQVHAGPCGVYFLCYWSSLTIFCIFILGLNYLVIMHLIQLKTYWFRF